jgi:hypothetical protein
MTDNTTQTRTDFILEVVARHMPQIDQTRLRARLEALPDYKPLAVEEEPHKPEKMSYGDQYRIACMVLQDAADYGTPTEVEKAQRDVNRLYPLMQKEQRKN